MKKDLISILDLSEKEIHKLLRTTHKLKTTSLGRKKTLKGKTLALLFQKPSSRTRISFEVAMVHMGGYTLYLSPREIDMGRREPVKDVACVVSRYVDCLVARVFSHEDILTLTQYSDVPVINGLSDKAHPCQALSDIFTIQEKFGSLKKVKLAYVGDGNNVLNSLLMISSKTGLDISIATPPGYEPDKEVYGAALEVGKKNRSNIELMTDPKEAVKNADVIYTDVWVSMGQEDDKEKKMKDFKGYQVNDALLKSTGKNTFIMHCLPAHRGDEVSDVVDGKNSIIYDQAENRMHAEKAVLLRAFGKM